MVKVLRCVVKTRGARQLRMHQHVEGRCFTKRGKISLNRSIHAGLAGSCSTLRFATVFDIQEHQILESHRPLDGDFAGASREFEWGYCAGDLLGRGLCDRVSMSEIYARR